MNIDLTESLLRFIVPPSLFWSILFYYGNQTLTNLSSPFLIVIIFVACGFTISSLGGVFTLIIDCICKPVWATSKYELKYWEEISKKESTYVTEKIATKWLFYYLNINSVIALFLTLIWNHGGNFAYLLLIIPFGILAWANYKRCYDYGEEKRPLII